MTNWCILRTAPSRTLLLAKALTDAGFRAWTPQETRVVRPARSKLKKVVSCSLTPTIVFSDYDRVPELVAMSRSPMCQLPSFHVFKHLDVYPRVADRALDALRLAEQRGRPKEQARVFRRGEIVRYADAGFEGLVGIVEGVTKRHVVVSFAGCKLVATIPPQSLLHDQAA